jgi:hypothetical protein
MMSYRRKKHVYNYLYQFDDNNFSIDNYTKMESIVFSHPRMVKLHCYHEGVEGESSR